MKRIKKGEREYISYMKKLTLIRTLFMFAVSGIIFYAGYIYNGKKENILTVVAVLGVLPACRSLVNFIMFMRFKSTDVKLNQTEGVLYDLIFTTEKDGSFFSDCAFCTDTNIILLASSSDINASLLEKHIKTLLKKNDLSSVGVKVFKEEKKFQQRQAELMIKPVENTETVLRSAELLKAITL